MLLYKPHKPKRPPFGIMTLMLSLFCLSFRLFHQYPTLARLIEQHFDPTGEIWLSLIGVPWWSTMGL